MKIRIEARPGELEGRLPDVIRALERLAGEPLSKAQRSRHPSEPVELLIPSMREAVTEASKVRDAIRAVMWTKIQEVLADAQ